jgi:hypothetical protein
MAASPGLPWQGSSLATLDNKQNTDTPLVLHLAVFESGDRSGRLQNLFCANPGLQAEVK